MRYCPGCHTTDGLRESGLCADCEDAFEDASIRSAINMGAPRIVGCYECGHWFYPEDFLKHLPCWEELDADPKKA